MLHHNQAGTEKGHLRTAVCFARAAKTRSGPARSERNLGAERCAAALRGAGLDGEKQTLKCHTRAAPLEKMATDGNGKAIDDY